MRPPSPPGDMDIADVRGYALSSPIEPVQAREFHGGVRRLHKRDVVLVVVETVDGARGIATAGASSSAMREYFQGDSQSTFADVVNGEVADALEGETVREFEEAHRRIDRLDMPAKLRHEAVSAVDVALHDLRGRQAGASVAELLAERGLEAEDPWYFPSVGEFASELEDHGFEVRRAELFDRPVALEAGEDGLRSWLAMFGDSLLAPVEGGEREAVLSGVEGRLRDELWQDGSWIADYRRLRFVAVKE